LATALGTVLLFEKGSVSFVLAGSLPPAAAEAAGRGPGGGGRGGRAARGRGGAAGEWRGGAGRRARADETLRRPGRGRRRRSHGRGRGRVRLPRAERRREDDVASDA